MENSMKVPQKTKYRTTIWPSNPTPGPISRQNFPWKRYMHPMFTAALFTTAKTWKQSKCPLTEEWIKKMYIYMCTHTHTYIYAYTQWNTTQPYKEQNNAICSNMDGTRDSHPEWSKSERERQIPHDITYIWKVIYGTNEPTYRKQTNSWTWRIDLWLPREKGREWEGLGAWGK